jgi:hypothetical protein
MKFLILLLLSFNVLASSYEVLLEQYNNNALVIKRSAIINDNYVCTEYGDFVLERDTILRIKKVRGRSNKNKVLITYPQFLLNGETLTKIDKKTFAAGHISLRKIKYGHLIILHDEVLLDCHYPEGNDDTTHLEF